jgi:hypothetical protein
VNVTVPSVDLVRKIFTDIERTYGSLEEPYFAFAAAALEAGMWNSVLDDLGKRLRYEERTDLNNDYGRVVDLQMANQLSATLKLSFVGPYGVFFRHQDDPKGIFIARPEDCSHDDERFVVELCRLHGVELLPKDILNIHVPLRLFDTEPERTRIYQALFIDADFLPGEYDEWLRAGGAN